MGRKEGIRNAKVVEPAKRNLPEEGRALRLQLAGFPQKEIGREAQSALRGQVLVKFSKSLLNRDVDGCSGLQGTAASRHCHDVLTGCGAALVLSWSNARLDAASARSHQ